MGQTTTKSRQPQLPERESQILRLASNGMTDKQIAAELRISHETVATYWRRILLRFDASSRTEVVAKATEYEAAQRVTAAEAQTEMLMYEIAQRTYAQAKELAQRNLLEALTEASTSFISKTTSFKGIFDQLLSNLLKLTQSEYGFMGEVLFDRAGQPYLKAHSITNIAWNESTLRLYEDNVATGLEFRNLDTLFGHVMTSGKIVVSNDVKTDPKAKGIPPGHPDLNAFLGIPVYGGNELVGMIGIANRPGGYGSEIVEYLQPMVTMCANMIVAYRAENDRQLTHSMLEESVSRIVALMGSISSGVLFEDANRKVQYANKALCELFSIPLEPEQLVGVDCASSAEQTKFLFEDPERFVERIGFILKDNRAVSNEWLRLQDGRVFSRDFTPILVGTERRGYLWHYKDVTDVAQLHEALKAVMQGSHDATVCLDSEGKVATWPAAAAKTFGLAEEEVLGKRLLDEILEDVPKVYLLGPSQNVRWSNALPTVSFRCSYNGRRFQVNLTQLNGSSSMRYLAILNTSDENVPVSCD